jgi:hypothetical protein
VVFMDPAGNRVHDDFDTDTSWGQTIQEKENIEEAEQKTEKGIAETSLGVQAKVKADIDINLQDSLVKNLFEGKIPESSTPAQQTPEKNGKFPEGKVGKVKIDIHDLKDLESAEKLIEKLSKKIDKAEPKLINAKNILESRLVLEDNKFVKFNIHNEKHVDAINRKEMGIENAGIIFLSKSLKEKAPSTMEFTTIDGETMTIHLEDTREMDFKQVDETCIALVTYNHYQTLIAEKSMISRWILDQRQLQQNPQSSQSSTESLKHSEPLPPPPRPSKITATHTVTASPPNNEKNLLTSIKQTKVFINLMNFIQRKKSTVEEKNKSDHSQEVKDKINKEDQNYSQKIQDIRNKLIDKWKQFPSKDINVANFMAKLGYTTTIERNLKDDILAGVKETFHLNTVFIAGKYLGDNLQKLNDFVDNIGITPMNEKKPPKVETKATDKNRTSL